MPGYRKNVKNARDRFCKNKSKMNRNILYVYVGQRTYVEIMVHNFLSVFLSGKNDDSLRNFHENGI